MAVQMRVFIGASIPAHLEKVGKSFVNDNDAEFRKAVTDRFTRTAKSPDQETVFPVGPGSAKNLGYDPNEVDRLPHSVTESFCGVGNPFSLGPIRTGDAVLDLGCGAGMDSILAATRVGALGTVIGIDMTPAMLRKAKENAVALSCDRIEFRNGMLEELPVEESSIDVAISNGVFNLCVDKPRVLREIFRVLRPGGRLQMADVLLHEHVTPEAVASKGAWSD